MKRHLFLTGPIGCGKSTAIANALGDRMTQCSGFLTRRHREPYLHFTLETPDGRIQETFLDFSADAPEVDLDVFGKYSNLLLKPEGNATPVCKLARNDSAYILDEIGGIELLNPAFAAALESVLSGDIPILGVLKGEGPAGALIQKLGLTGEYELAVAKLRHQLRNDPNTLIYECTQYDEQAFRLVKRWMEVYLRE